MHSSKRNFVLISGLNVDKILLCCKVEEYFHPYPINTSFRSAPGGTKNNLVMGHPSSRGLLESPYQNPAAAAALLAMHQSSSSSSNPIPHYNYLQSPGQIEPTGVSRVANYSNTIPMQGSSSMGSPFYNPNINHTHSFPDRMPTPQDLVNAAAKRLNDQITASRNIKEDSLKGNKRIK